MLEYRCKHELESWLCQIHMIKSKEPYEMNLDVNGNRYHMIVGSHSYGNYLCIPNWSIGSELASLCDTFWNTEQLMRILPTKDAIGIAEGIKLIGSIYEEDIF